MIKAVEILDEISRDIRRIIQHKCESIQLISLLKFWCTDSLVNIGIREGMYGQQFISRIIIHGVYLVFTGFIRYLIVLICRLVIDGIVNLIAGVEL